MRKTAWVGLAAAALLAALLWGWLRSPALPTWGAAGRIWLFQFAPENAPGFANFTKVTGRTLYDPKRGFGWLDVDGDLATGTFHDETLAWEAARNLNLIQRGGPDELAASYANGSASFALDLEPGTYDVWLLSGDNGLLEYVPHEPFEVEVEGVRAAFAPPSAQEWIQRFETPGADDAIDVEAAYERYVAPRFRWRKLTVPCSDGQLTVRVVGALRDRSPLDVIGTYAFSDLRKGPPVRFTGALNALIATRTDPRASAPIEQVDALRRESFRRRWPAQASPPPALEPAATDSPRGYRIFQPSTLDNVLPATVGPDDERELRLRATPGEYVPITFAIRPLRELGATRIRIEEPKSPRGSIGPASFEVAAVRHAASPVEESKTSRWAPAPTEIVRGDSWQLSPNLTKQFWLTLHVPENAAPGHYEGAVVVDPERGERARIPLALEVLPFRLVRPAQLAAGVTYFVPVAYSLLGQEQLWARVRADFADMRRHGLSTVQLTGMGIENYAGLDRLFAAYRAAGFEHPIYLLEAYAAIEDVVERHGHAQGSERFYAKYEEIFRRLIDEASRRGWPPLSRRLRRRVHESRAGGVWRRAREAAPADPRHHHRGGRQRLQGGRAAGPARLDRRLQRRLGRARGRQPGPAPPERRNGRTDPGCGCDALARERRPRSLQQRALLLEDVAPRCTRKDRVDLRRLPGRSPQPIRWNRSRSRSARVSRPRGYDARDAPLRAHAPGPLRPRLSLDARAARNGGRPGPSRERAEALLQRIDHAIDDDYTAYQVAAPEPWTEAQYRRLRDEIVDAILPLLAHP